MVGVERAYEDLANAIVLSGVREYKRALSRWKRHPTSESAKLAVEKGERFLQSPWFEMLTDVDPSYLIRKLKEEC
ncbi:MAG: hypothetical protein IIZ39_12040 [Blautia sp.]|nr:hypothetical protein [Blautia sp.]